MIVYMTKRAPAEQSDGNQHQFSASSVIRGLNAPPLANENCLLSQEK